MPRIVLLWSQQFLKDLLLIFSIFFAFILFIDVFQLLSQATKFNPEAIHTVLPMALMRTPKILSSITPFIFFITAFISVRKLKDTNQILGMEACGIPYHLLLLTFVAIAFLFNCFVTAANPISWPLLYKAYEIRKKNLHNDPPSPTAFVKRLVFEERINSSLRRVVFLQNPSRIHQNKLTAQTVFIVVFNQQRKILQHIQANHISLTNQQWVLTDGFQAHFTEQQQDAIKKFHTLNLTPSITLAVILDHRLVDPGDFSLTENLRFLQYRNSIGIEDKANRTFLIIELLQPLFASVMVFLACVLALPLTKKNSPLQLLNCFLGGVFLYSIQLFSRTLGVNGYVPPLVAAIMPSALIFLFALYCLFSPPKSVPPSSA